MASVPLNKIRRNIELSSAEVTPFDMYFCSLASMNMHPGTTRDPPSKLDLADVTNMALDMIEARRVVLRNRST